MCSSRVTIRFAGVRGFLQMQSMNGPECCPFRQNPFPFLPDLSLGTKHQGEHS